MILFQEGEWMLFVTPFHHQFRYVYFQKQNRSAFKILSAKYGLCFSCILGGGDCFYGQIPALQNNVWGFSSWLGCRLLSDCDQTTQCLGATQQCYHCFLVCLAFKLLEGKECFLLLLVDELVNQVGKQRVQDDVDEGNLKNLKTWLQGAHLKCLHRNKQVPRRKLYRRSFCFFLGINMTGCWSEVPVH